MTVDTTPRVIICGGGPVGFFVALKLSRANIPCLILERAPRILKTPRACGYSPPCIAELDRAGILDEAMANGTPVQLMQMQKLDGTVLADNDWSLIKDDSPYPYALMVGQHTLADIMYTHCQRYPGTKVLFDHEVEFVTQDANSATVSGKTASGEPFSYSASYVVGADGGKSTVRKQLGVTLDGFTWDETYLATNIFYPFEKLGYAEANFVVGGGRDWAIICRTGDKNAPWRCTYGEGSVSEASDEEVYARVPERLVKFFRGANLKDAKVDQIARYNVHQRCAKSYKFGRVFLAGDAAHLTQPIGGYGLTTGITDAACLGDALAATILDEKLHLLGDRDVLEEYSTLRRNVFLTISNERSIAAKKTCQMDPENLPQAFLDDVKASTENPDLQKRIFMSSMDLQTLLDLPKELKGEEWGPKGEPKVGSAGF